MRLSVTEAQSLVAENLIRNKVSPANARSVAIALVSAEAAGQGGHGLRRVPAYAAQALVGKVNGFATPVAAATAQAVLSIDAAHGFAYPAFDLAVETLSSIARGTGIAMAAISRSHHAGVMGLTVERFAERGLMALMVANAPAAIAPWGGRKPLFGTNPIAFAAPIQDDDPIVIDLAMSTVARGKVMSALQKGERIPEGWAFDQEGRPTTDASKAMDGSMVPLGDAKGAALALMVEILAAGLTGANYGFQASSLFDDRGPPPALGQTIIVINPQATGGANTETRLRLLADTITADGAARLPGRRGQTARRDALENGLEVEDEVLQLLRA